MGADLAQILSPGGQVFDATAGLDRRPLLSGANLRRAARRTTILRRVRVPAIDGAARLLATPVKAQDRDFVVVVGASLKDRDQALADLGSLLLIGGPAALLLTALAGYGFAAAALAPVESMRARAAAISSDDLDQRLPLSPSRDELQRLGRTLNDMLGRLESGLGRERAFVADASHEPRTPLAMLKTELELIARDQPGGADTDGAVASAIAETDRLTHLTEDLLVITRAGQDRLPLRAQTIVVRDLLTVVAGRYTDTDGRQVRCSDATPNLCFRADRARLEQALTNLVENAVRHGDGQVLLSAIARDGFVELHVTDEGAGVLPNILPAAFERFTRAGAGRSEEGTGLGLAIVAAIARGHGGSAHAANRPHGSAEVWLNIPTSPPEGRSMAAIELQRRHVVRDQWRQWRSGTAISTTRS